MIRVCLRIENEFTEVHYVFQGVSRLNESKNEFWGFKYLNPKFSVVKKLPSNQQVRRHITRLYIRKT